MVRVLQRLLLILISLSMVACTTTRIVAQGPDASLSVLKESPALGNPRDSVILVTRDGSRHAIRLKSVSTESVSGTSLDEKQSIVIRSSDIERVEVDEINTRTVVAVVVISLVLVVALAVSGAKTVVEKAVIAPLGNP